MEIRKLVNDYEGFDIEVLDGDKKMLFSQHGADPHIEFRYSDFRDIEFPVSIDIHSDMTELYDLIDQLYNNIKTCNLFWTDPNSEFAIEHAKYAMSRLEYKRVFHDNLVEYIDDSSPWYSPDIVKIIPHEGYYTFMFDRKRDLEKERNIRKAIKDSFNVSICIRQDGSRLNPFHIPFNWFYKNMQNIQEVKEDVKVKKRVNN